MTKKQDIKATEAQREADQVRLKADIVAAILAPPASEEELPRDINRATIGLMGAQ